MNFTLGPRRKQLGRILIDMGLISQACLDEALIQQRLDGSGERLGARLLRRGLISAGDYVKALARQHQPLAASR